jgi:chitinase
MELSKKNRTKELHNKVERLILMGFSCQHDLRMTFDPFDIEFDFSAIEMSETRNIIYTIIKTVLEYGRKQGEQDIKAKFKSLLDLV